MPEDKVRVTTKYADGRVESNMPPAPPAAPPPSPKQVLAESGLDPKTIQVLMALMAEQSKTFMQGIAELRKPTEDEQKKLDEARERRKQASINAAEMGKKITQQILDEQRRCGHVNPRNMHLFRGQVHSDGWARIKCQRCMKSYTVRPLPEMVAQGLNLDQIPGLTAAHLEAWEKQSGAIDAKLQRIEAQQAKMRTMQFNPQAGQAPVTGL